MGKTAARNKTTIAESGAQRLIDIAALKQRFIGEALGLGWRLAATFIVPVVIGAWLDNTYDSKPVYTLGGIAVAVLASVVIISRTVKSINRSVGKPIAGRKNHV